MRISLATLLLIVTSIATFCAGCRFGKFHYDHAAMSGDLAILLSVLVVPAGIVLYLIATTRGRISLYATAGAIVNLAAIVAKIGLFSYPIYYLPFIGLASLPIAALFASARWIALQQAQKPLPVVTLLVSSLIVGWELSLLVLMR